MLAEMERIFFAAMRFGWASGGVEAPVPQLLGWSQIVYEGTHDYGGRYQLVDRWGKDPATGKPSGQTIITDHGIPGWGMWYGRGSYEKRAIPLLKEALMQNYRGFSVFCGGRGPAFYSDGKMAYVNNFKGDFSHFEGEEYIYDIEAKEDIGGHKYWGGSLLYLVE